MRPDNREGTLRLFRSVVAGRDWLRSMNRIPHPCVVPDIVLMKPGDQSPPVFIIPGASGSILELGRLVSNLTVTAPVYAPLLKGLNAGEIPCSHIQDIALHCVTNITAISVNGPYILVGYSLGGVIALEIAHQLTLAGHGVPLVVLLESYPSEKVWPISSHFGIVWREIKKSLTLASTQSLLGKVRHVANRVWGMLNYILRMTYGISYLAPAKPDQVSVAARRLYLATLEALKYYRPPTYGGRVVFIEPATKSTLDPVTPQSVWRKYLSNLEVRRVPGSHMTMIGNDAPITARELSDVLTSARSALTVTRSKRRDTIEVMANR